MALRSILVCNQLLKTIRNTSNIKNKNLTNNLLGLAKYTTNTAPQLQKDLVEITFVKANGEKIKVKGKVGDNILDVVVNNEVDLDGFGACEGTLTCSTCHVILKKEDYDRIPDKPTEDELDMLDLAFELTDTSRLGCQVVLTKDLDGLEVRVPATVNDARSSS